jgi:large repetitive protein
MNGHFIRTLVTACILAAFSVAVGPLATVTPTHAAASLTLSRSTAAPGDSVIVSGYGFHPGDDAIVTTDVLVGGKKQHVQSVTTVDSSGRFHVAVIVPGGTTQGTYVLVARDFHGASASRNLIVIPLAYLTAGGATHTAYVIPAHDFYVGGAGFKAGESIAITATFPLYGGNAFVEQRSATADAQGRFSGVAMSVPGTTRASGATITATGRTSHRVGKGTLQVTYRPALTLGSPVIHPGAALPITGAGFVPGSTVRVTVTISSGSTSNTLSRTVTAGSQGQFTTALTLPASTPLGKYTVTSVDAVGGFRASSTFQVALAASIVVNPGSLYPGQSVAVSGANFPAGTSARVSATFPLTTGQSQPVVATVTTNSRGGFVTLLPIPALAKAGRVAISAVAGAGHASSSVYVNPRPTPIPTARPTATPSPVPTVPNPPTLTPTPVHHTHPFRFAYISIWYHVVRNGTPEHVVVQSTLHTRLGIWVHVYFPSGKQLKYYQYTNSHGKWEKQVNVPRKGRTGKNDKAIITIRLWHGKQSIQAFSKFKVIF